MTDITKCTGEGCPLKETCYRFTAPAEMYQSYFMTPPVLNGKCEYHWSQNATSNQSLYFLQQLKTPTRNEKTHTRNRKMFALQ
jgi:hypothetical protein